MSYAEAFSMSATGILALLLLAAIVWECIQGDELARAIAVALAGLGVLCGLAAIVALVVVAVA